MVSFYAGVSSEIFDFLDWYVDGTLIEGIAGTATVGSLVWKAPFYFTVPPGTHTITWAYEKDGSVSSGLDGAWIDGVLILNYQGAPKITEPEIPEGIMLRSEFSASGTDKRKGD